MEFKIKTKSHPNMPKYADVEFSLAKKFAESIKEELGDFLKSVILFGSSARQERTVHEKDIDVLMIVNDLTAILTPEVIEAYRVITENTASKISKRMHITTMKLTNFWDYVRNGDPIIVNMLRDGIPLHDTGFFEPAQNLLFQGRISPTKESIWAYHARAPNTILNSEWHIIQAVLDLYWAVIDSAHSALMKQGETPASPALIADLMEQKLVKRKMLEEKYVHVMRNFYKLMKMITHREIMEVKGEEYDRYFKIADDFVKRMRKLIEHGK